MDDPTTIVMKLALKGMDPAEVEQLARQTGDQLHGKMTEVYTRLENLHKQAKATQDKEEKRAVNEQIKEQQRLGRAVQQVINSQQIGWRRLLEDMENVTVVLGGAIGAISGVVGKAVAAAEKVKEWGDEMVRVTNIHNAFRGNLDELREATGGEIAGIDLMIAHNRALAGGLELTNEEFKTVAASADQFADAVGESTEEGLNKLIQALTTGSEKALKLMGVVVDNTKAQKEYADALGLTVSQLDEEQKLQAFRQEAIEQLKKASEEAIPPALTIARAWEIAWASIKGSGAALAAIGNVELGSASSYAVGLALERQRKAEDERTAAKSAAYGASLEAYGGDLGDAGYGGTSTLSSVGRLGGKAEAALAAEARAGRQRAQAAAAAAEKARQGIAFRGIDALMSSLYKTQGIGSGDTEGRLMEEALGGQARDPFEGLQDLSTTLLPSIEERIKAMEDDASRIDQEAAGGGIIGKLLFGRDGVDVTIDQTELVREQLMSLAVDMKAAQAGLAQMAGDGLFDLISGAQSKSIREATKAFVDGLGRQFAMKAIYWGLESAGFAITGNLPAAGAALGLAGAYAVAAGSAGLASRALAGGQSSSAAPATQRNLSSFSSGGLGGSGGSAAQSGGGTTIVINGALPGSEYEIGRNIERYRDAYARQSGRKAA